jgi:hypothetical protein
MKKIVEEVGGEGLNDLLGKKIMVYSCRFFYTGTLKSFDSNYLTLSDAKIIYDTGTHQKDKTAWESVEDLWAKDWRIRLACVESFGEAPF